MSCICFGSSSVTVVPSKPVLDINAWESKTQLQRECSILLDFAKILACYLERMEVYGEDVQREVQFFVNNMKDKTFPENTSQSFFAEDRKDTIFPQNTPESPISELNKQIATVVAQANAILKVRSGSIALNPLMNLLAKHADEPQPAQPEKIHVVKAPASCCVIL